MNGMQPESKGLIESIAWRELLARHAPDLSFQPPNLSEYGVEYLLEGTPTGKPLIARVGACEGVAAAEDLVQRSDAMASIGPAAMKLASGTEALIWKSPVEIGSALLWQCENAVLYLALGLPWEGLVELANAIDRDLATDPQVVRRSASLAMPAVERIDWPERIVPGQRITAELSLKNVDPGEALIVSTADNALCNAGPPPSIFYVAPPKPGIDEFSIVLSTPGHLVNEQNIQVQIQSPS